MIKRLITATIAIAMATYPLLSIQASVSPAHLPAADPMGATLSAEQIDNLMAPIALYPDPLLAQMLPASTFVEQIDKAARFLRAQNNQSTGVDTQDWDVSVKSIAHYPEVVFKMSDKLDWTTAVGQAYVTQAVDVFGSIQRLRNLAKKYGYLATTPQQTIIVEKEVIKIVPAQPQYIYVPTYSPQVVYVAAPATTTGASASTVAATAAIAFTTGLLIGAWLNNDCNWYSHTVYYHGWRGTGWVSHSATVVHRNNSYYVNNRYNTVHHNAAVVNRNVNYNNVSHYSNVSRNVNYNNVNRNNVNVNNVNVNNVNRNNVNTNNINTNNVNNRNVSKNVNPNNVNNPAYRGKQATPTQMPANAGAQRSSVYGTQARSQSQRGQASRASASAPTRTRPTRSGGGRTR